MTLWALLGAPFAEALLLVGIHTYLGLHVLRRGVIFVDLALAQVAALGGLVAFLVGLEPGSTGAALFSLVFALVGAAMLSLLRPKPGTRVPQEALIGLVYAMASAIALLLMSKAPEGAEELSETMTGSLLWVRWETVGRAAATYAVVALVHFIFRRQLLRVSEDSGEAARAGLRVGVWDFVFYGTFAVVVTHSVATAGVLLVFVFLVAPACLALLWFKSFVAQLLFGWGVGLVVCVTGLWLSYAGDLPTGPTVVGVYAAVLALAGLVRWFGPQGDGSRPQLRRLGGLLGAGGVAFLALFGIVRLYHSAPHEAHAETAPPAAAPTAPPSVSALLARVSAGDLPEEKQAACAGARDAAEVSAALGAATDPFDRLALARCLQPLDAAAASAALARLADDPATPTMVRDEARAAPPAGADGQRRQLDGVERGR